jgi:hypothetical protein
MRLRQAIQLYSLLIMPDSSDVRVDAKRLIDQLPAGASWDDIAY